MRGSRGRQGRAAFTLLELLIVIAIIAVLVALLMAGVTRVFGMMQRTETSSDITQMQQSLGAAKAAYQNIPHLPSQLILYNDIRKYTTNIGAVPVADQPLARQTGDVLRYMFGKRFLSNPHPAGTASGAAVVYWGTGGDTGIRVNGPQCLVFYLGGLIEGGRCVGFSKNPQNPTIPSNLSAGTERLGPFFQFKAARLVGGRYNDPYGNPFLYFGAYSPNNYNAADAVTVNGVTISPYYEAGSNPTKWLNPDSFQIISAGRDRIFGPGGAWSLSTGYGGVGSGSDDLANFSQTELGNPQE